MDCLAIHLPARHAAPLAQTLARRAPGLGLVQPPPRPALDIGCLACLKISLEGTSVQVRAPYVFPFLDAQLRREYKGMLHCVPGVDWLYLGGGIGRLAGLAAKNAAVNGFSRIELHGFERLEGELSRTDSPGDVPVTIARASANYNQAFWESREADLLALPEERWGELGANTTDFFALLEPHIRRFLARPPRLIVDLGCGLGQTARSLAKCFPEAAVLGLDASPQAINVARQTFTLPNLDFQAGDISEDLGLPRQGVDLIVSSNALMYARDQGKTARGLFAALHPDGACLNQCRIGASHRFWDFPRGLLLPTDFQLEPADYAAAAREYGLATQVLPAPGGLGLSPLYFYCGSLADFKAGMENLGRDQQASPPGSYAYHHSHALLAHSRRAAGNADRWFASQSHVSAAGRAVLSLAQAPEAVKNLAVMSWLYCFNSLRLDPEAVDFMAACLAEAAGVIRLIFGGGVLGKLAHGGAQARAGSPGDDCGR